MPRTAHPGAVERHLAFGDELLQRARECRSRQARAECEPQTLLPETRKVGLLGMEAIECIDHIGCISLPSALRERDNPLAVSKRREIERLHGGLDKSRRRSAITREGREVDEAAA